MIWTVLIIFEAIFAAFMSTKLRIPAAGLLIMAYIVVMKATFVFFSHLGWEFDFGPTSYHGYYYRGNETLGIYTLIYWCIAFSLIWAPRRGTWLTDFRSSLASGLARRSGAPLLALFYVVIFANLIFMDKSAVWSNGEYLLITGPKGYYLPSNVAMLFITTMTVGAVICSMFMPFYLKIGGVKAVIASLAWAFWFAFYLSVGSRFSAIMFFSLFLMQFLSSRGAAPVIYLVIAFVGAFILMMVALATRASGEYGLSNFFGAIGYFLERSSWDFFLFSWINLVQGIFVTSDGLIQEYSHSGIYKILAFSPLPSFIDSFNDIRPTTQIMLHETVPMSGISEIYHFGGPYIVFYFLFLLVVLRSSHKLFSGRFFYLASFANIYIFIMFVVMNSYAVRNSFRQTLLAYLVITVATSGPKLKKAIAKQAGRPRAAHL